MSDKLIDRQTAYELWRTDCRGEIERTLKTLLQEKHLYQSLTVADASLQLNLQQVLPLERYALMVHAGDASTRIWKVEYPGSSYSPGWTAPLSFRPPDVKLFCQSCDRIEAFNLVSAEDFLDRATNLANSQAFIFGYQCQSCKDAPETFLIRRDSLKLTICGRAPMEVALVPRFIPKSVKRFYGGALVAHQSGQTLAGIFLLRMLLEQWARSQVPKPPSQADILVGKYMASLPADFRARFSSMRTLYGRLSEDIHAATGSEDTFKTALMQIDEHFDARRIYKLDQSKTAASSSAKK
ncbi:MAG TPA: hypothetical protein VES67_13020 [Vicinamibacterales bacterium]|nr:hypothetical protein [Vicinamibacterales bacterium]